MKHIRHYFCTALLGTAVLTACSGAEKVKSNTPVQITMWNYYNGAQKERWTDWSRSSTIRLDRNRKIVVESVSKGSVSELEDAVRDSTDGKTGSDPLPDFCSAYADAAYDLWKRIKFRTFVLHLTDEEYDSYISGYLEEGNFGTNAAMMIFPVAKSTEVLTLNSTAWEPLPARLVLHWRSFPPGRDLLRQQKAYYEWTDAKTETPRRPGLLWARFLRKLYSHWELSARTLPFIPAKTEVYPWMWIRTRCAASGITSMCLTSAVIIWRREIPQR